MRLSLPGKTVHNRSTRGETLCGLLVPWFHGSALQNCDVLWFIDNEAAVASLIRGSSTQTDVHTLVQVAHFLFQRFQIRVWLEWIDSESNPSDGLSRLGTDDPWTNAQLWEVSEVDYPSELRYVFRPSHLPSFSRVHGQWVILLTVGGMISSSKMTYQAGLCVCTTTSTQCYFIALCLPVHVS